MQIQRENKRLKKIFQMPPSTKVLKTTSMEIFTNDVMSVFGMLLLILYIYNMCYCAEIQCAAVLLNQRALSCCSIEPTPNGFVILQEPISHEICLFSFCGRHTNHLPDCADVVTRQRATDARLLFYHGLITERCVVSQRAIWL